MLEADALSVDFSGLRALDGVGIRVHPAEIVAVIGPNGAGKTTLFNCLSGFVRASSGHVSLDGERIDRLQPHSRAALGLGRTFQQGGLCLSESALGNLLVAQHHTIADGSVTSLLALGRRQAEAEHARQLLASEVLEILCLSRHADTAVSALPYGMRKSLELGCALLSRPRILLVDEPAAGASQADTRLLAEVIRSIRRDLGIAILLIDHHVPFVADLADYAYAVNFGRLLTEGTVEEVTGHDGVREAYLGHKAFGAKKPRSGTSGMAAVS